VPGANGSLVMVRKSVKTRAAEARDKKLMASLKVIDTKGKPSGTVELKPDIWRGQRLACSTGRRCVSSRTVASDARHEGPQRSLRRRQETWKQRARAGTAGLDPATQWKAAARPFGPNAARLQQEFAARDAS